MLENLSPREREIFDLFLEGISPKEIAHQLNISYSTVDFHRTKLYNKLGVHSIQELFAKYSTNGKEAPTEQETAPAAEPAAAIPVSGNKKHKRLKLLLSVGIMIIAFSVLLLWVFIRKSSVYPEEEGNIISAYELGFFALSDAERGGKSKSKVFITQEKTDGEKLKSVLNIKINLVKEENRNDEYANALTHRYDLIQRLRLANGIRFKARGDGKLWDVEFHTIETTQERAWASYSYMFSTVHDHVVIVDIPYSSLFLPEWYKQYPFDFNKETIKALQISANNQQGYGPSFLQIFDFEIY